MSGDVSANAIVLDRVSKRYGGIAALKAVSFTVATGAIFGIIGPNGAGKSTLIDVMTGLTPPTDGQVEVLGQPTRGMPAHRVAALGVGRAFQRTALYAASTVAENLRYGRLRLMRHTAWGRMIRSPAYRADRQQTEREADEIMQLAGLAAYADTVVGTLSYGVQRRVAIGTAMMTNPRLLLLDEPAAGMNDAESAELVTLIRLFAAQRTVVVVEHDMTVITALCDQVLAMVDGAVIAAGPPHDVLREPAVVTAYLGADDV